MPFPLPLVPTIITSVATAIIAIKKSNNEKEIEIEKIHCESGYKLIVTSIGLYVLYKGYLYTIDNANEISGEVNIREKVSTFFKISKGK